MIWLKNCSTEHTVFVGLEAQKADIFKPKELAKVSKFEKALSKMSHNSFYNLKNGIPEGQKETIKF
jgi:hypothetical protein